MAKVLHAIGLAAVLFLTPLAVHSSGPAAAPPHAAPAAPPAVTTAAEVIGKSSEVTSLLGTLAEKFAPSSEIEKIERSLGRTERSGRWFSPAYAWWPSLTDNPIRVFPAARRLKALAAGLLPG
jgi:hypothetical protein